MPSVILDRKFTGERRLASGPLQVFRSSADDGFSTAVTSDPRRVSARKLQQHVQVRFAPKACVVETAEGQVHARPGDAIVTGVAGELWRVSRGRFAQKYRPVPPTLEGQPGSYESLPNQVLALRLDEPFLVVLGDEVSELKGYAGDWLVDYGDGSLGVVAADIFDLTYETLP